MNNPMVLVGAAIISVALLCGGAGAQGTTDKIEGTAREVQGSVEETVGNAAGDTRLEWSGKTDKVEGAAQNIFGDLKNTGWSLNDMAKGFVTRLGDFVTWIF